MLHHLMGLWLKEIPMISGRSRLVGEIYASHRFPDVLFLQNIYKYTVIATLMCWGCFFLLSLVETDRRHERKNMSLG